MRNLLTAVMLAMLLVTHVLAGELKPYTGRPLPDFTLTDLHGKEHKLSHLKGKVVMVNFWATYCTPCIKEMPSMQRLDKKFKGNPFQILAINMAEDHASVEAFMKRHKIEVTFPILLNTAGDVAEAWMVTAVPTTFVIDRQGHIRYALYGAIEWDSDEVIKTVDDLMKP